MSFLDSNAVSVLNILNGMDAEAIQTGTTIERTGMFESRKVTINGESCSIRELVSTISEKILNADVTAYDPDLDRLKRTLIVISACEVENRDCIASMFHWFSSRDNDVLQAVEEADKKIRQHLAFMVIEDGYVIQNPTNLIKNFFQSIISSKPEDTYKCSDKDYTVHEAHFYLDCFDDGFDYSFRPSDANEQISIPALISHRTSSDGDTYRMIFRDDVVVNGMACRAENILELFGLLN